MAVIRMIWHFLWNGEDHAKGQACFEKRYSINIIAIH
jgi:hypothetical protein